jgi:Na+/melibiose symporter-like transporter
MGNKRVSVFSFKLVQTAVVLGVAMFVVGYALSSLGNTQLGYFLVGLAVVCGIVAVVFLVVALIARIWERDRISN